MNVALPERIDPVESRMGEIEKTLAVLNEVISGTNTASQLWPDTRKRPLANVEARVRRTGRRTLCSACSTRLHCIVLSNASRFVTLSGLLRIGLPLLARSQLIPPHTRTHPAARFGFSKRLLCCRRGHARSGKMATSRLVAGPSLLFTRYKSQHMQLQTRLASLDCRTDNVFCVGVSCGDALPWELPPLVPAYECAAAGRVRADSCLRPPWHDARPVTRLSSLSYEGILSSSWRGRAAARVTRLPIFLT